MSNENNQDSNISNNKNISENKIDNNINQKNPQNLTSFETKKYNDFLGVFGDHKDNSKYFKPKNILKRRGSKSPKNEEIINVILNKNNVKEIKAKKRNSKTPFKLSKILFFKKNKDKEEIKNKIKDNKINDSNGNKEIKNKVKKPSKIYELSFYEPFNESVKLLDGEGHSYDVEFIRNEFEIMIVLNENKNNSFNDIQFTNDYFSFPQYCINHVEYNPDTKTTFIKLKDYRCFKIQTSDEEFFRKISFNPQNHIDFLKYAFLYNINIKEKNISYPIDGWQLYKPMKEFERQQVPYNMDSFRVSSVNSDYKVCETYPAFLLVPSQMDDATIVEMASCRTKNRFPILTYVYTHPNQNSVNSKFQQEKIQTFLFRSSQINTGILFKKNNQYEIEYINALTNIGKYNNGFVFYDCRPYISAKANSLKGAGLDEIKDYYNCKELIFGNIENIHAVRKSLKKSIEKIYYGINSMENCKITSNSNIKKFLSKFEETKWLDYISDILTGADVIINRMLSRLNVICHCSDGWDRTSQVCSTVQIILDPYFRTFEGFAVLIEKDWISCGHQFAIRNGCDYRPEKRKERSPIFIQFLHVVYQIMVQYPTAFEFETSMLLYLSEEIYSNKFGTFLFNCEKELEEHNAKEITMSIWSDIFLNKKKYLNPYYKEIKEPLNIKTGVQYLCIWKEFFYKYIKIGLIKKGESETNSIKNIENCKLKEKENIIQLLNIIKKNGLEEDVKNNELYKIYKDYLTP